MAKFIGKERESVGFLVIEGNLWSPLNQINTRDSALTQNWKWNGSNPIDAVSCVSAKCQNIMYISLKCWKGIIDSVIS